MTFEDNNFEITSAIPRAAAVPMDKANGKTRSKRAKWRSEKGADELFGVPQMTHPPQKKKKKNPGGNRFSDAGGRTRRTSMVPRALFMALQPTEQYKQNLRQPAGISATLSAVEAEVEVPAWVISRVVVSIVPGGQYTEKDGPLKPGY